MRVVVDTNVLWVSISRRSQSNWIFKAILEGTLTLCVTTDILEEYAEIISMKLGAGVAEKVLGVFDNLPNIEYTTTYYKWRAISADPDNDKFVDCAVAADAVCIISEDNHFKALKDLKYPKVKCLSIDEFQKYFEQLNT